MENGRNRKWPFSIISLMFLSQAISSMHAQILILLFIFIIQHFSVLGFALRKEWLPTIVMMMWLRLWQWCWRWGVWSMILNIRFWFGLFASGLFSGAIERMKSSSSRPSWSQSVMEIRESRTAQLLRGAGKVGSDAICSVNRPQLTKHFFSLFFFSF